MAEIDQAVQLNNLRNFGFSTEFRLDPDGEEKARKTIHNTPFKMSPSSKLIPQPNFAQEAVGRVGLYLDTLEIFGQVAKGITDWRISEGRIAKSDRKIEQARVVNALEDIYRAKELEKTTGDNSINDQLKRDWGEEYLIYERLLNDVKDEIEEASESNIVRAGTLGVSDRIGRSIDFAFSVINLNKEQRTRAFVLAGYNGDQTSRILRRLGGSSLTYAALYGAEEGIPSILGISEGSFHPWVGSLAEWQAYPWVVGSAALYFATYGLRIWQTGRNLRNEDKFVSNPTSAGAYYLMEKFVADDPGAQQKGIITGYVINPLEMAKEWFTFTVFIPVVGPSIFTAGNLIASAVNTSLFLGVEGANYVTKKVTNLSQKRHSLADNSLKS